MASMFYFTDRAQKGLSHNQALTVGKVEIMESFPRTCYITIRYRFQVGNKLFTDLYILYVDNKFRNQIEGLLNNKNLPIVYDMTKFNSCGLQLFDKDFIKYKINKPD